MNKTVLSGMRATGKLHLGNYFGALTQWLKLQKQKECETIFCIADLHTLTIFIHISCEIPALLCYYNTGFFSNTLA